MSLERVVEDIRAEARERAEEIREEGEREAADIVEAAEADAEEILADAEAAVERDIDQERDQRLSSARLEAKQMRLAARREILREVRSTVEDRIAALEGDRREELTRALLEDATEEFEDGPVRVAGRPEDRELLETILADYDGYEYGGEYDCLGGVVVESDESRIRVNNTFDSVLDAVWEDDLRTISEGLFEQ